MPQLSPRNVYAQSDGEDGDGQGNDVGNHQQTAAVGGRDSVVGSRVRSVVGGAHGSYLEGSVYDGSMIWLAEDAR